MKLNQNRQNLGKTVQNARANHFPESFKQYKTSAYVNQSLNKGRESLNHFVSAYVVGKINFETKYDKHIQLINQCVIRYSNGNISS